MIGVVQFPGTNCDQDVMNWALAKKHKAKFLWHLDQFDVSEFEALILPGGFSYGDYLRSGALASRSPVMNSVKEFANRGGPVLGICNGFQILCEAGLLPGALVQNEGRRFIDQWVNLQVHQDHKWWGKELKPKTQVRIPIAHGDGRFYVAQDQVQKLWDQGQVWLTYENNPNGSVNDIAGVFNEKKNVAGLMPHPERALYDWMGSKDGWSFL